MLDFGHFILLKCIMKKIIGIWFVLSFLFLLWCSNNQNTADVENIQEIAQCLWEKWVRMYGTETCSFCLEQEKMFGEHFKYITYIDCLKNPNACSKIQWTPTREFANWEMLAGLQQVSVIAQKAGCLLE